MLIPAALLMALVVVFTVILSGGSSCAPPDRASVLAYQTARDSACEQSPGDNGHHQPLAAT